MSSQISLIYRFHILYDTSPEDYFASLVYWSILVTNYFVSQLFKTRFENVFFLSISGVGMEKTVSEGYIYWTINR